MGVAETSNMVWNKAPLRVHMGLKRGATNDCDRSSNLHILAPLDQYWQSLGISIELEWVVTDLHKLECSR